VTRPALRGRLRPTEQQRLLLRCALGGDEAAPRAWAAARRGMDFDRLDEGSHGVLPLVYRALERTGVQDPLLGRLKGIYRKAWFANQLLRDALRQPLGMLEHAGAEPLLVHDTAMMCAYYGETAMRRVPYLDVAVRAGTEDDAVRALERSGWSRHPDGDGSFPIPLLDVEGRLLCVHAGLPEAMRVPGEPDGGEAAVWARAETVDVAGAAARVLSPTDQLLCSCAVGPDLAITVQALWLADVALLAARDDIDWAALAARARERRISARAGAALAYVRDELGVDVPAGVSPADVSSRDELAYRLYRLRGGPLGGLPQTLSRHVRQTAGDEPLRALAATPRFLGEHWGVERPGMLPAAVVRRALARR
jgi:hypothetical protein